MALDDVEKIARGVNRGSSEEDNSNDLIGMA